MGASSILVLGSLPEEHLVALQRFECVPCETQADLEQALGGSPEAIEGILLVNEIGVSAQTIDRLPNLKMISNYGAGYDDIDMARVADRGIAVSYTPSILSDDVADIAIGLMLMTARHLGEADRFVRSGAWAAGRDFPLTGSLYGCTLGILGYGGIGRAAARRASAFGLNIAYHSRRPVDGEDAKYCDTPLALAAESDILLVTAPGGAATHHIVNADVLRALGRGLVINVGRGSVIDTEALITALERGELMGAGLDVIEDEPAVPARLLALPNVVILPHVGSATTRARSMMARLAVDNIVEFFTYGRLLTPTPEMQAAELGGSRDETNAAPVLN
ncbi:MAG: 2-hydroxyacid dehydrogenase [Sphingomonadales bacterium]|nr:MAG: 2-hydroxyacid dehydrogenase [Sphingomonadales bacterium]